MFIACVEICFKLCYTFRISLYSTQYCMIYWLCEPLFCRKKNNTLTLEWPSQCMLTLNRHNACLIILNKYLEWMLLLLNSYCGEIKKTSKLVCILTKVWAVRLWFASFFGPWTIFLKKWYEGPLYADISWTTSQYCIHGRSQGQIFTEANMLITSPVGYVVKCSSWRPNILTLFNLGW